MKIVLVFEGGPKNGNRETHEGDTVPESIAMIPTGNIYANAGTISHTEAELVVRFKFQEGQQTAADWFRNGATRE